MKDFEPKNDCRVCCGSNLETYLDLGETPLANSFLSIEQLDQPEKKYPLEVNFCHDCDFSQLSGVVDPKILFENYVYFSSGMPALPKHFRDYATEITQRFVEGRGGRVIEIGSNDGLLLGAIQNLGPQVLGVDPATNIVQVANSRGVPTMNAFFGQEVAQEIVSTKGQADVIIGNNVVAHINDYEDLMGGVTTLLQPGGAFVFEAPHLLDMFQNLAFDTVYHEHLSYLSVGPMSRLMQRFGMEIFDVKSFPVQGNSIRVYASQTGARPVQESVEQFITQEKATGMTDIKQYHNLAGRIGQMKTQVVDLLTSLKQDDVRIAGYGAPAKGNTLLNYYGIDQRTLDYATEELPSKIGLYTPGTHIPVIDMSQARQIPPDFYLLLAWNYKGPILEKEAEFRRNGGKFIMPIGEEIEVI